MDNPAQERRLPALPELPAETLERLAGVAEVPTDHLLCFAEHVQCAFAAASYMAWSEARRHPLQPSRTLMRAAAKALRGAAAALKSLGPAEAFALLGSSAHEPQHAVAEHVEELTRLAATAEAAAGPKGRPPARRTVVASTEQAITARPLSAAEWLLFELYRAAQLHEGGLGLDKARRSGSILRAWKLIEPHTSLQQPSLDRVGALIAQARRDLSQDDDCAD